MDNEAPATLEDRFLDVVLNKAPAWFLTGAIALAGFIAVVQFILVVTK